MPRHAIGWLRLRAAFRMSPLEIIGRAPGDDASPCSASVPAAAAHRRRDVAAQRPWERRRYDHSCAQMCPPSVCLSVCAILRNCGNVYGRRASDVTTVLSREYQPPRAQRVSASGGRSYLRTCVDIVGNVSSNKTILSSDVMVDPARLACRCHELAEGKTGDRYK